MPTRFEIERALKLSRLPPTSRHVMHVLCTRMDAETNLILPRYQPSLTNLARETGYDRRTITRHLTRLEAAGWLIRVRPTLDDARTKHKRTAYTPLIPEGSYPQARAFAGARGTASPDLGAQRPKARGTQPQRFSSESSLSGGVTPTPATYQSLCGRCGLEGHTAAECKE